MKTRISKTSIDATKPSEKDSYLWDDKLTGFGLKVTPAGRKVFLIQYRMSGRTRRVTLGVFKTPNTQGNSLTESQARQKVLS
ncbi:MAG: DUF4102 domain-containing protein, partial [Hellea sp.]|nr:DUF4102 domain-containing protein [Hellea sp.]